MNQENEQGDRRDIVPHIPVGVCMPCLSLLYKTVITLTSWSIIIKKNRLKNELILIKKQWMSNKNIKK